MDRETYKVIKRRFHVARQRALSSTDPAFQREYERAKAERDRAWDELAHAKRWDTWAGIVGIT